LPYKHDDHTTAINLIDGQLEKINLQVTFAREQDKALSAQVRMCARQTSNIRKAAADDHYEQATNGMQKDRSAGNPKWQRKRNERIRLLNVLTYMFRIETRSLVPMTNPTQTMEILPSLLGQSRRKSAYEQSMP
jgi:hypothetical protein